MTNSFIIGGISGCISQSIVWPIEYMKTIKQLPEYRNLSIIKTIKSDIKFNGITNIYRGLIPQVITTMPRTALRYSIFDHLKNNYSNDNISNLKKLSFGMIAGGTEAIILTTPSEVIKVQLINNKNDSITTLKNFYKNNGIKGFYKGSLSTTLRQSTNHGITFLTVENLRPRFNEIDYIKPYSSLFAGMIGGTIAVTLNNPIDVIKTYKQSDRLNDSTSKIIKEIYLNKGIKGFYSGLALRSLRVGPMYGITFFIYDSLTKYFEN